MDNKKLFSKRIVGNGMTYKEYKVLQRKIHRKRTRELKKS